MLPLSVLEISQQMTMLLNVQRMLLKVLPLSALEISQQMTLLLNVQRMLLTVLPLSVVEISQQLDSGHSFHICCLQTCFLSCEYC